VRRTQEDLLRIQVRQALADRFANEAQDLRWDSGHVAGDHDGRIERFIAPARFQGDRVGRDGRLHLPGDPKVKLPRHGHRPLGRDVRTRRTGKQLSG